MNISPTSQIAVERVPVVPNGSAAASASLNQTAAYAQMMLDALDEGQGFSNQLAQGFLDDAIDYGRFAYGLIELDENIDNDGMLGIIEGGVIGALSRARDIGEPADPQDRSRLAGELNIAFNAATNTARALELLVPENISQ